MSLTPETGSRLAQQMALNNADTYRSAIRHYGSLLAQYCEDFPNALALGHLVRVNPLMTPAPIPTIDRRRGFMFAPVSTLASIAVKWENLDDPTTCAYVWGYDVNVHAKHFYNDNSTLFTKPETDFWRCVYARHVLGSASFDVIWSRRDRSAEMAYNSFLYAVNNLKRSIPGWNIIRLKHTVFVDCAYSYELSKQSGTLLTDGFGREPVLNRQNLVEVFQ